MSDNQLVVRPNAEMMSFSDVERMADAFSKSRLFPAAQTKENALALMMLCQSEGLHPAQAVRRYHVIQGTVAMRADAMLAEFQLRGGKVRWVRSDADEARAVFSHPVGGEFEYAFTIAEAKQAGLPDKNPNWKKYPAAQLRARCVSGGIRMILPGIVTGIYTPEEVEDFGDRQAPAVGGGIEEALKKKARKPVAEAVTETVAAEPSKAAQEVASTPAEQITTVEPVATKSEPAAADKDDLVKQITDLRGKHKVMQGVFMSIVGRAIGNPKNIDATKWTDEEASKVLAALKQHCGVSA
jgi:hypothetical protein